MAQSLMVIPPFEIFPNQLFFAILSIRFTKPQFQQIADYGF